MSPYRRLAISLACLLPLSGCIDETTTLELQADGRGTLGLDIRLRGELAELANLTGELGGEAGVTRIAVAHLQRYAGVAAWTDVRVTPGDDASLRIEATGWFEDVTQVRREASDDGKPARRTWTARREGEEWVLVVSRSGPTLSDAIAATDTPLRSILDESSETLTQLEGQLPELIASLSEADMRSRVRLRAASGAREGWSEVDGLPEAGWDVAGLRRTLETTLAEAIAIHRRYTAGELDRADAAAELDALEARTQSRATARVPVGAADPAFHARFEAALAAWTGSELERQLAAEPEERSLFGDVEEAPPAGLSPAPTDRFEPNQSAEAAKPLEPGRYENLQLRGEDWYRVTVPGGQTLVVTLEYDESAGFVMPELQNPATWAVVGVEGGYEPHTAVVRYSQPPGESIALLLQIGGLKPQPYHLTVALEAFEAADAFEPNDSPEQAQALTPGRHTDLVCDPRDHYRLEAPAGAVVTVEVDYAQGRWGSPTLTLGLGPAGYVLPPASTGLNASEPTPRRIRYRSPGGELLLEVASLDEGEHVPYTLIVSVDPDGLPADRFEPNQDEEQAAILAPGTYSLSCDPVDVYRVRVPAGQQARFSFGGEPIRAGVEYGGRDRVGGRGQDVSFAYGPGGDAEAELLLTVRGDDLRAYELTLAFEPWQAADAFEPNDTAAQAKALAPGVHTELRSLGDDWYALVLTEGQTLTLDLEGEGFLRLELHDPAGAVAGEATRWTREQQLQFSATQRGVYTLRVSASHPREPVPYQLSVAVE